MRLRVAVVFLVSVVFLLSVVPSSARIAPVAAVQEIEQLFDGGRDLAPDIELRLPGVIGSRRARVDMALLDSRARTGDAIGLRLAPDVDVAAVLEGLSDDPLNGRVWTGHVRGVAPSTVVMVSADGLLGGSVSFGGRAYSIVPERRGVVTIRTYDLASRPLGDDFVVAPERAPRNPRPRPVAGTATSVIDVLGLFIPSAVDAIGGIRKMKMAWRVAVAAMNAAYKNSKIDIRARLMAVKKIPYSLPVTDFGTPLGHLRTQGDGQMEKAHGLRNRFGADFVAMALPFVSGICGLGYLPGGGSGIMPFNDVSAFSVSRFDCVGGFDALTVAHEAGHNQGLRHNREDNSATFGAYSYSFGFRVPGFFATVMSYACTPDGLAACPPIANFSNPAVRENGKRTGVQYKRKKSADNARSLNNDRAVFEGFRPCKKNC